MNARRVPVWMWLLAAFVVLRVVGDLGLNLMPLLLLGFVAYVILGQKAGRRGRVGHRPRPTPTVEPTAEPGSMPTIDVPRYPGSAAEPEDPWTAVVPTPAGGPPSAAGMSSLGSDPAVSLVQLQVAQGGRDLEQALATGQDARVEQALSRLSVTVEQAEGALATSGAAGAGTTRAALAGLRAATQEALRSGPGPGRAALVARVISACRAVGQTGAP